MGDTDGILSLAGAWKWIRKLNFKTTKPWTPWLSKNEDLLGYVKEFNVYIIYNITLILNRMGQVDPGYYPWFRTRWANLKI